MNESSEESARNQPERPLCVDLDGTLLRGDTFWEQTFALLRRNPLFGFRFVGWAIRGKRFTKERMTLEALPEPASFRLCPDVVAWLAQERARGRRIELVTGTHRAAAEALAAQAGVFDAVFATTPEVNLTSHRKAAFLRERHGAQGFDYAGNSSADLAVWKEAHTAHAWHARPSVNAALRAAHPRAEIHQPLPSTWSVLIRQLRVYQWVKNLLVFLPLLLAHRLTDVTAWGASGLAFVVFSLAASGAYCLNDLFDLAADRQNPHKSRRPLASGDLALVAGVGLALALPAVALGLATMLPRTFLLAAALYLAGTVAYSLHLKRIAGADVVFLTGLYALRILAGGLAAGIPVTQWLLGFSVFFFLSLSLLKRHGELLAMPARATDAELPGRSYRASDADTIRSFGAASAYVSVLVLILYMSGETVTRLYRQPQALWLLGPLLLFWFHRLWLLSARGLIPGDPIPFVLRDRTSYVVAGAAGAILWLAH